MENSTYWKGLGLSALISAAVVGLILFFVPALQVYAGFSGLSIALFCGLSIATFYAGKAAAKNSNKLAFNNLVISSVFIKLVFTLLILFLYKKAAKPEDGWFAVLFMLIYAVFTSFEVMFLTKQAKA